jgi:hypothetical protein
MSEKQRLKHEADNHRVGPSATLVGTDRDNFNMAGFREPKTLPRLTWVNYKTSPRGSGRKNDPGRKPEHAAALAGQERINRNCGSCANTGLRNGKPCEECHDTRQDLSDHQAEVPVVATGTPQA